MIQVKGQNYLYENTVSGGLQDKESTPMLPTGKRDQGADQSGQFNGDVRRNRG